MTTIKQTTKQKWHRIVTVVGIAAVDQTINAFI